MLSHAPLQDWFLRNKRDFPWRDSPTPYQVWISEVMLQQTQASRVIDFYLHWMRLFPDVHTLAQAHIDDVLKAWEGLGYYSRARSLHEASRDIVKRFSGTIPSDIEQLASIKGLGPYTVGAICAFGYHQKQPAVDANVARVLTRFFELQDDISKAKTLSKLRELTLTLLPDKDPHIVMEAFIELGASICTKKPKCSSCPLQKQCKSYQAGTQESLPIKSQKTTYEALHRDVAVVIAKDHLLLRQGQKGIACSGLYEFPYFTSTAGGKPYTTIQTNLQAHFGLETEFQQHLDEEKHSFTKYRVTLYPKLFIAQEKKAIPDHEWHDLKNARRLTFSSGHRRLLWSILNI
jgi:A/G-specific adenine glycosylase